MKVETTRCDECINEWPTGVEQYGQIRLEVRITMSGQGFDFCSFNCLKSWVDRQVEKRNYFGKKEDLFGTG